MYHRDFYYRKGDRILLQKRHEWQRKVSEARVGFIFGASWETHIAAWQRVSASFPTWVTTTSPEFTKVYKFLMSSDNGRNFNVDKHIIVA